jgi:hypothetical protein
MNEKMIITVVVAVGLVATTAIVLKMVSDSIAAGRHIRVHTDLLSVEFNPKF